MYTVWRPLSRDGWFSCGYSSYQLGCTVAAISAQRPVEHFKNASQNTTDDLMPHCVILR